MPRSYFAITLLAAVMAAGCASQSRNSYPVLEETKTSDADLSCRLIDEDLLEANELRDRILDEHGDVIRDAVTGTAVQAVTNPVGAVLSGVMKSVSVSSATKRYTEAVAAAGVRMEKLLVYKREKDCPSGPTANPNLTDDEILAALEDALTRFELGQIDDKEYLRERSKLLDQLRY